MAQAEAVSAQHGGGMRKSRQCACYGVDCGAKEYSCLGLLADSNPS